MYMTRPSYKEINGKIKTAKIALADNRVRIINKKALISDAFELGYLFDDDFVEILDDLLNKTTPEHYTGTRPPLRSYESDIHGIELFAFTVKSTILDVMIYYKFSIKDNYCYLVSLHEDR